MVFRCSFVGITLLLVCPSGPLLAEPPVLPDITRGWKFKTGDESTWSRPSLDDSGWSPIRVGQPWEEQGHADYDGYSWYRLRVPLADALREHPDFLVHQALKLTLGKIDDVDETWFNGTPIGRTGKFPDAYSPAWQTTRSYLIPSSLIRWDEENVIAVRVYDGNGEGGLVGGDYRLEPATWGDFLKVDFDLGRGDGIFATSAGMTIAASLGNGTGLAATGVVEWIVQDDEKTTLATESMKAVVPANSRARVTCSFVPELPGFYRVTCSFRSENQDIAKSESMVVGLRPLEVQSPLTRQPDFDDFWQATTTALAEIKPGFTMTHQPAMDSDTHEVYEVEMRSLGGVRVGGWYEKPRTVAPCPALLRVPGYGENMRPTGTSDPLAVLSFNIRGHGNSQQDVSGNPQDFWIRGLEDKQGYFYQGAYADCIRAVDFLASRREVDASRTAVTGGSQGGGLSLVTAALDRRISLCAPDIPFLCDWVRYFRSTDWPEMDAWIEAEPHRSWEKTLQTMGYFDALNFADRIQCPVFLGLGLQDDVCPPATIFSVYNRLGVPKDYRVYPFAGHWVDATHNDQRRKWILNHFGIAD